MPDEETVERAREDAAEGKAPSTQAGEFVREEMHHVRRRQARRALDQAGDRHRTFQGPPRRSPSETAGSRKGQVQDPQVGGARVRQGPVAPQDTHLADALTRDLRGAQA